MGVSKIKGQLAERVGRYWRVVLDLGFIPISSAIGIIAIALGQVADQNGHVVYLPWHPDRGPVLAFGFILTLVGAILGPVRNFRNTLRATRLSGLEQELGTAKNAVQELSRVELADLSDRLNYSTNERISLFMPAHNRSNFRLVARYSITNEFMERGRATYPLDQGCLGRAWQNGEATVLDLPDPQIQLQAWKDRLRADWQIPEEVSAHFRMRSRTCIAFGIYPALKPCQGVIVFESQQVPMNAANAPLLDPERLSQRLKRGRDRDKLLRLLEVLERLD